MKLQYITTLFFAASSIAMPLHLAKRDNIDGDILQFALTLEHLENAFYKEALSTWSVENFTAAGFTEDFYNNLKYIAHDEEAHVVFLEEGLKSAGLEPVAACTYKFKMADAKAFVSLAATIEGVGVSAYLGAAPLVTSKSYLTYAASVLVTEALHQSELRSAVGEVASANPFGTAMGINAVYTIASGFISDCPSTNAALPVKSYKALTVNQGEPISTSSNVTFTANGTLPDNCFVTYVSGLDVLPVSGNIDGNNIVASVPMNVTGQSYAFITSDSSANLTDSNILFGPAIIEVTPSSPSFNLSIT
ncbi:uncharacterized protein PRCAT00004468001 [Priceomyces carsonii]|uniref:uncharacterized protein n=1 Tax=Priceomyces carsonii TaxID=28549 RepID=UPI002EDAEDBB|nr:unnamed protein product [Priceomyces carsonii]